MIGRSLSGLAAFVALLTLTPSDTPAKDDRIPDTTSFSLPASNGYKFGVTAVGLPEGDDGVIGIDLVSGERTYVAYSAPATVTSQMIDADLGSWAGSRSPAWRPVG